jgi:hypothetical protein
MDSNELLTSTVPRALETKTKLFGFELGDILVVFFNLAFQNLLFGTSSLRYPIVWGSTTLLAVGLFMFKRGKPDGFLQHYGEYLTQPTVRSANAPDSKYRSFTGGRQ